MLRVRILTASLLGVALLVSLFLVPARWTVLVFALVFTLAAWEWSGFGALRGGGSRLAYTAALAALLGVSWVWSGEPRHLIVLLALACCWWIVALLWLVLAPLRLRPGLALLCGVPALVPAFIAVARVLVAARGFARGSEMVLWMMLLVFAADVGAFFVGRRFGRHKLAPRVSPAKTWEGAIGGVGAVALVAFAGSLHFGLPVIGCVAFGCAVGVFSIVGDLTESLFKRAVGLKDSGTLLPGHGGVLDRIDSITAAAPLYAFGLFGAGVIE